MELAPCPNCSGFIESEFRWVIGRPHLLVGPRSKKIFVSSCCAFSSSKRIYNTEEEAAAAWSEFRAAKSAKDPRLAAMIKRIDELDWRHKARNSAVA